MSQAGDGATPDAPQAPSPQRTLRRLFLTLFLRGRTSRGLQKDKAPSSIGRRLLTTLAAYALFGLVALAFRGRPIFDLSVYLHGLSFAFVGMFLAASAGEILFNQEEADILLHRPIDPGSLLWAKVRVLVEVSLWLSASFNIVGFFVGLLAPDGGPLFVLSHAASLTLETLFCCASVVLIYQLCLRLFGRERLDNLMTTAQVVVSIAAVIGGQMLPQLMARMGTSHGPMPWYVALLPPAWFAGIDAIATGNIDASSSVLAALALASTAAVLFVAFGRLADEYQSGMQLLTEHRGRLVRQEQGGRRFVTRLVEIPPLSWLLRDPVSRASFVLCAAYLVRDRDVKLRIYPGLAPFLVMPFVFLMPSLGGQRQGMGSFGLALAGVYLGMVPMIATGMLQFSQHWQAADVFHASPIHGPARLCDGARLAVLALLTVPLFILVAVASAVFSTDKSALWLLLPGAVAVPLYARIPNLGGGGTPLSMPAEQAKAAGRGLLIMASTLISMPVAGLAYYCWYTGALLFVWFIVSEVIIVGLLLALSHASLKRAAWQSLE